MDRNKYIIQKIFKAAYYAASKEHLERLYNIYYQGMDTVIQDPNNIEANWNLEKVDSIGRIMSNEGVHLKEFRYAIDKIKDERKLA